MLCCLIGEMEDEIAMARLARADMVTTAETADPGIHTTNRITADRTLAGRAAIRAVEKAMEAVEGASIYRNLGIERRFRDLQGARFHPVAGKGAASLCRSARTRSRHRRLRAFKSKDVTFALATLCLNTTIPLRPALFSVG
jgi:hypothetical protein